MTLGSFNFVFLGLTITSSRGNGHAQIYRALIRELVSRGHNVLFLERDVPHFHNSRDLPVDEKNIRNIYGRIEIYQDIEELQDKYKEDIAGADVVIVGSLVPEGIDVGEWVQKTAKSATAFYDIDTPTTLSKLHRRDYEYISPRLIEEYDLYLSSTGGSTLPLLEAAFRARSVKVLYCSVDVNEYYPEQVPVELDLAYMANFSNDREPLLERLLVEPARRWPEGRFIVAGENYPDNIRWPKNVKHVEFIPENEQRLFFNAQRYFLNLTRAEYAHAGYCPRISHFQAAACGTPVISDYWDGLSTFFIPGRDIFISHSPAETLQFLRETPEEIRRAVGEFARKKVMSEHTSVHRASELELYVAATLEDIAMRRKRGQVGFSRSQIEGRKAP